MLSAMLFHFACISENWGMIFSIGWMQFKLYYTLYTGLSSNPFVPAMYGKAGATQWMAASKAVSPKAFQERRFSRTGLVPALCRCRAQPGSLPPGLLPMPRLENLCCLHWSAWSCSHRNPGPQIYLKDMQCCYIFRSMCWQPCIRASVSGLAKASLFTATLVIAWSKLHPESLNW